MHKSDISELSFSLIYGIVLFIVDKYAADENLNQAEKIAILNIVEQSGLSGKMRFFDLILKRSYPKELIDFIIKNHPHLAFSLKEGAENIYIDQSLESGEKMTYVKNKILNFSIPKLKN